MGHDDDTRIWQITKEEKQPDSPEIKLPEAPGLHEKYEKVPIIMRSHLNFKISNKQLTLPVP